MNIKLLLAGTFNNVVHVHAYWRMKKLKRQQQALVFYDDVVYRMKGYTKKMLHELYRKKIRS